LRCWTATLRTAEDGTDPRTYRKATASELAILIVGDDTQPMDHRDVAVYRMQSATSAAQNTPDGADYETQHIDTSHPSYLPMHFPLLFPRGEAGWCPWLKRMDPATKRAVDKRLTMTYWASCMLMTRADDANTAGTAKHRAGRLFQELCLECFAIVEEERMRFLRNHQDKLRADKYMNVQASTAQTAADIGKKVVMPSTFISGRRYMLQKYQDAMAIVRRLRRPSLFLTFTCNPRWPEIQKELLAGQEARDRPT
jgi:hypothetical protein